MKRFALLLCIMLSATALAQLRPEPASARQSDADAVRKHIESIFDAFIQHDGAKLQATHAALWRGFLEGSRVPIRGGDQYMQWNRGAATPSPNGMKSYKMSEFDPVFYGDVAIVPFVADVTGSYGGQTFQRKLRILDVYAKLDGNWIQVGSDTDLHPDSLEQQQSQPFTLPPAMKQQLLADREKVWRAYFANDRAALEALPAELTTIEPSGEFGNRASVLAGAARFAESGGSLKSLEFPRTEVQVYGNTAIIYTTYKLALDHGGQTSEMAGNATEIFVHRDGKWVNVGWHLDSQH